MGRKDHGYFTSVNMKGSMNTLDRRVQSRGTYQSSKARDLTTY